MYKIHPVARASAEDLETVGAKRKFWFTLDDRRHLFKAEERGTGEDWAEKIVCELARILGLPHVNYELAHEYDGGVALQPGVICPSFSESPLNLVLGNQLLMRHDPTYPGNVDRRYHVREYTIAVVAQVMEGLLPPATEWMTRCPESIVTAMDVFAGYLMLDAWVANQDRHHQNWGAVDDGQSLRLAPTFDHGSSLARNLTDEERKKRLETADKRYDIRYFIAQARSGFYRQSKDRKTLLALEAFQESGLHAEEASKRWLGQLDRIGTNEIKAILEEIPPQRMAPVTREFTFELLRLNRERLLESL